MNSIQAIVLQEDIPQQRHESVRLAVLRYLLESDQEFRDLSRGKQVTRILEDLGWCDSSIPTVLRELIFWQSHVRVAPASPEVEAKRLRKKRANRVIAIDKGRREGESLSDFQKRVLEELPEDLSELALTQLGNDTTENETEPEDDEHSRSTDYTAD